MPRMRAAKWQGEHGSARMSRYDIFCVHTIAGFAPAHAAQFSTNAEGGLYQSRDTKFQSGANLDGNHRVIAIENEDKGPAFKTWSGTDVPPFTQKQVRTIAEAFAWSHKKHGIPLQMCPNSKPGSRGLAYHRQGCDGNFDSFKFPGRVPGGEKWSAHFGKVCPGDRRIAQLPEILKLAKEIANPPKWRVIATKVKKREFKKCKAARVWAKAMRLRKFKTEVKEL